MAHVNQSLPYDKNFKKQITRYLNRIARGLAIIGKPPYLLLSYLAIALLFIFYITGLTTRLLSTYLLNLLSKSLPLIHQETKKGLTKISTSVTQVEEVSHHTGVKYSQKIKLHQTKLKKLIASNYRYLKKETTKASLNLKRHYTKSKKDIDKSIRLQILPQLKKYFFSAKGKLTNIILLTLARGLHLASQLLKLRKPAVQQIKLTVRVVVEFTSTLSRYAFKAVSPLKKLSVILSPWKIIFATWIFIISFSIIWVSLFQDLPKPEDLLNRNLEVSTKIFDRNGILLYKIYKNKNRTPVPLRKIPLHTRLATLAIEDAEFYSHPGFSVRGIIRALYRNLTRGELTGGSTVTQQLVKNALLTPEKTLSRKVREIILAVRVELKLSKDEILELYLNEVSYGGTAYGIQEASQLYFGKDVTKLTLAESALLAGLPKSPTKYSPFGSDPQLAFSRQKEVLKLMEINEFITEDQRIEAENERVAFNSNRTDIKAPHFVMYVRSKLEEKYGREVVEAGGLEVITTLDYSVQKAAEEIVRTEIESLKNLQVGNGAALVIEPSTGEVLAMVGSKDYFDIKSDGNVNVTLMPRSPGSSIKIVNYSYALENGYTPASILSDSPVTFSIPNQKPYSPKNYDSRYRGNLTLRSAFAESRNVPAVKVLATYGVNNMIEQGRRMGITTWNDPSRYGLSLTLGGGEVKLIDLATAYATVANYGNKPEIISIKKITNYKGKVLEENQCSPNPSENRFKVAQKLVKEAQAKDTQKNNCNYKQVIDPRVAFILTDILSDNQARTPAFGSQSQLVIPNHKEIAVKTGTSNDLRDNVTIGYNQKYLVAVWVGNNDYSPMSRVASGVTGASPIFNKIMTYLIAKDENHPWEVPQGLVKMPICKLTGTLTCTGCPTKFEWFLKENAPKKSCSQEQIRKIIEATNKKRTEGQIFEPAASTTY